MVRTTMSTFPSWIAGMRSLVGMARKRTLFSFLPTIWSAIACTRSMSKPSNWAPSDVLFGSR